MRPRIVAALVVGFVLAITGASAAGGPPDHARGPKDRTPVTLQFLNVSDWHGQLDPIRGVGGAAVLSAYFQQERVANPNTLTITAGDAYGAAPPLSSFFDEVPAVYAMRLVGFDVDTFGNHNFDRGVDHLQEMIDIATAPQGGAHPGTPFTYVAANLRNRDDNLSGVKDWHIFDVGGVKVGVVGLVNEEAPTLVFPGSFGTIEVTDAVRAANKARAEMKRAGAQVFVAITHKGIRGFENGAAFGELIDFADNVGGFDLIFGDHTDLEYSGVHGSALVSMNRSKGVRYSRTLLTVDPSNGRVIDRSVEFVVPLASAVTPDPAIVSMLQPFRDALAPILNTQIGSSSVFIPRADACGREDGRLCESLVGNTVTDSMRLTYGTDFAITNAGGLRADLTCPTTDDPTDFCPPYTPPPFPITRGQVLTVLPFGNVVVTVEGFRGDELKAWLEHGVSALPGANGRFAQVSGLCFTYDVSAPAGSRVTGAVRQAADGSCTGAPIDLTSASSYTLATNDFMASGGDGYPDVFARSTSRDLMDQVLADYVSASSPISPSIQGRITCTSSGATACPVVTP